MRSRFSSRVEVEVGRRGRTLRVDGTFASWYAPGSVTTGSVWDALAAPLLLLPPARRRSVLVLGLGAGSAARVARALAPAAAIVGVERDREVLRAARRWFDLDELGLEVVRADARRFLERCRERFDAILEDVFVGRGAALGKPDWLPVPGLALAARHLAPNGVLVSNTLDEAPEVARELRRLLPVVVAIDVEGYDNRILVGAGRAHDARGLRAAVGRDAVLGETLPRLSFRTLRGAGGARGTGPFTGRRRGSSRRRG
jgi:spermidine synthase